MKCGLVLLVLKKKVKHLYVNCQGVELGVQKLLQAIQQSVYSMIYEWGMRCLFCHTR
jgi:hypothetical protein